MKATVHQTTRIHYELQAKDIAGYWVTELTTHSPGVADQKRIQFAASRPDGKYRTIRVETQVIEIVSKGIYK